MNRLSHLDGLRGLAILLVYFYHAFSRWQDHVPYGDEYSAFPLFNYGYYGVHLFFIISGFVIFMSLDRSQNFANFFYKRWLRLFPAMLACSIFIYATASFFYERPGGVVEAKDLISGLLFIEPSILSKLTGLELISVEGVFWSLYVEFKFYIISALIYFFFGSRMLAKGVLYCYLIWLLCLLSVEVLDQQALSLALKLTTVLSFNYFGWFAVGAYLYLFNKHKTNFHLIIGAFLLILCAIVEGKGDFISTIAATLITSIFIIVLLSSKAQTILSTKFFMFFGFISYPLYLMHENMMVSVVIKLDRYIEIVPQVIYPFISLAIICFFSYFFAHYVEPAITKYIKLFISYISSNFSKMFLNG